MRIAVRMDGISKHFGAVQALENVSLEVRAGTMHAIVGENGAGKTTLMRILHGELQPDEGTIAVDSQFQAIRSPDVALKLGIGMVSQHYGTIPQLSVLENLILGSEQREFLSTRRAVDRASGLAERLGFQFDWNEDAENLSPAAAQKLEILKLLWRDARVLVLDEPTAMLSPQDASSLFGTLRDLSEAGSTVILVTHKLPEVMNYCEQVTVLRHGRKVANLNVKETSSAELAGLIVGKSEVLPPVSRLDPGNAVLRLEKLYAHEEGMMPLSNLHLTVRECELVGVAGVDGNGQRELARLILGLTKVNSGVFELAGTDVAKASPAQRIARGLRMIPEDRLSEAIIAEWSVADNAVLGLHRNPRYSKAGLLNTKTIEAAATRIAQRLHTRFNGLDEPIDELSGGNQQRLVAARSVEEGPRLIVAFQPARGLDISGTQMVYRMLREAAAMGAGVLVIGYDLDELLAFCDRILVMSGGAIRRPSTGRERDRSEIGRLMVSN